MNRREAIKLAGMLPLTGYFSESWEDGRPGAWETERPHHDVPDQLLRLGIIGFGIRGEQLVRAAGFPTRAWRNKIKERNTAEDIPGPEELGIVFTGVCDLFDFRAEAALDAVGKTAKRYRHYQDMLASRDIDAVLIATPDHMHARMIIDAARAGKHVYVEKCLTHTLEEVYDVYDTVKETGITFQLGHQLRQKDTVLQARDILHLDVLGATTLVQTTSNRNSPNGAWIYDIPGDANEKNIDWRQFDDSRPFDPDRFFRWRKYWDYGTGLAGDLLTHEFDTLNFIMGTGIPDAVMASGGIYFYRDEREVPDVFHAVFEFTRKRFTLVYSATLANDYQRPALIMGHDATMHLDNSIQVFANENSTKYKEKIKDGIMATDVPFYAYPSESAPRDPIDAITGATSRYFARKGMMSTYKDGKRIDPTRLHIMDWLLCIRNGLTTRCDIEAGFEEAVTAHMATLSCKTGKKVHWDQIKRTVKLEN